MLTRQQNEHRRFISVMGPYKVHSASTNCVVMTELLILIHRIRTNIFFYFFLESMHITCDLHSCIQCRGASFRMYMLQMCHPISLTSSHPFLCRWKSRMQQLYCSRCILCNRIWPSHVCCQCVSTGLSSLHKACQVSG